MAGRSTAFQRSISSIAADVTEGVRSSSDWSLAGLRRVRREISAQLRTVEPQLLNAVALRLIEEAELPRWFVYELLNHRPDAIAELSAEDVEALGEGISSWDAVDVFACYVSGPAWREGSISRATIKQWAQSEDRWWRRAALVSTVPLNNTARGGRGDTKQTLFACDLLRHDRDDMVVKALSWALRELAKKDPAAVAEYVQKRAAELPARVLREVGNKLDTGVKNPRGRRAT